LANSFNQVFRGAAGSGGGDSYWISIAGTVSIPQPGIRVAADADQNYYATIFESSRMLFVKYDKDGDILFRKKISTTRSTTPGDIALDSSNNIYMSASYDHATTELDFALFKFNSSGSGQFGKSIGQNRQYSKNDLCYGLTIDSSDNIIISGLSSKASGSQPTRPSIVKYNSSGVVQWHKLADTTADHGGNRVTCTSDGSDNVFVAAANEAGSFGGQDLVVLKYNSSGALQFARAVGLSGTEYANGIALDSSGNIYVCGRSNSTGTAGGYDALLAKLNSSGVIQWARLLGSSGTGPVGASEFSTEVWNDIAIDGDDNIYVGGTFGTYNSNEIGAIAKYNSSGTLQWQNKFTPSGGSEPRSRVQGITIDVNGNIIITGEVKAADLVGAGDFMLAKLPSDGSGTEDFGEFNYESSSYTAASVTLSNEDLGINDVSTAMTVKTDLTTDTTDISYTEEFDSVTA
jgi:uncharacterized delta-60 repeat protein